MIKRLREHNETWQKIEEFKLDEPGIAFPFSKKLAKENNWSSAFSQRVIEEYKRFIFLCVTLPRGASPPPVVDLVWHLHLTYTKSYWEDFCGKTLGKSIHHHPSKGGAEESNKHVEWYKDTLDAYRQIFAEEPPADIWPKPVSKTVLAENKGQFTGTKHESLITAALLFVLPFAFIYLLYNQPLPFRLNGPHFLVFYFLLTVTSILAMYVINRSDAEAVAAAAENNYPDTYSIYEAIQFLFGKHTAVQAAIIDLLKKDLAETSGKYFINKVTQDDVARYENPLIPKLLQHGQEPLNYKVIASMMTAESGPGSSFSKLSGFANKKSFWPIFIYIAVLLIGIARFMQGLLNDKPAGFLVAGIVLFTAAFWSIHQNTNRKARVLKTCRQKFRQDGLTSMNLKPHDEILRDFSFSGVGVLSGFKEYAVLSAMFAAYTVNRSNYYMGDAGSISGCGGSSCGGSGCGGGGCGGCGGD